MSLAWERTKQVGCGLNLLLKCVFTLLMIESDIFDAFGKLLSIIKDIPQFFSTKHDLLNVLCFTLINAL